MNAVAKEPRWWQGATLYQIYVRSWRDSDRDGYGDLGGVIAGLDYLEWLGVDGIWLSPTTPSPDHDWGYDVSGYLGVHPDLGTLADMDKLIAEAASGAPGDRHAGGPRAVGPRGPATRAGGHGYSSPTVTFSPGGDQPAR